MTEPLVVTSTNEIKLVRIHVSGLPPKIAEKDIEERFKSFGNVQKVDLIPHPFEEESCRGFAYVNLETSDGQLSKCMNILNGCSWKGGKLHISLAKANKFETLEDGKIVFIKAEGDGEKKPSRKFVLKKKRKLVRHSSDQSLVTDKNVDKRKGWRRGRYGRAIASLKIRRPNRQIIIIDPSHYKNNLEKLFGSIKPKPLTKLTWTVTEIGNNEQESGNDEPEESVGDIDMEMDVIESSEVDFLSDTMCKNEIEIESDVVMDNEIIIKSDEEVELNYMVKSDSVVESDKVVDADYILESDTINTVTDMEVVAIEPVNDIQINTTNNDDFIDTQKNESSMKKPENETKFEVNVNWSSLFNSTTSNPEDSTGSFSLNSMIEKSKIKDLSIDELFHKTSKNEDLTRAVDIDNKEVLLESAAEVNTKKVHNYAHLFADLNRITPTTATRFGMLLTRKDEMLQEWRIKRIELKEDFKKRLAEGKRRNRRINVNTSNK